MLTQGARLGPYEIVAKLGAGGMGEVWRARDTRLDREVALKLLPAGFADDNDRHARFEREAKVLASLNHPNIAHLYGLEHVTAGDGRWASGDGLHALPRSGDGAGTLPPSITAHEDALSGQGPRAMSHDVERAGSALHVLVMELVDGEDLAARLTRGSIPVDEAIAIARQIAEALEAAHEKGIVHRDLKPANVKVRPDGTVKVLDFGLAKALDPATSGGSADLAHSPTLTHAATQAGLILGTAAYMSPEQAKGAAVDKRADIWAFGVVLWEMLTGKRLFAGDSVAETLAGVLRADVDLAALPAEVPAALRQLLRRCLERSPRNRLHDIADARIAIDEMSVGGADHGGAAPAGVAPAVRGSRRRVHQLWAAALVVASAGAALLAFRVSGRGVAPREPHRLAIHLAAEQELTAGGESFPTFTPDGRSLVFPGRASGRQVLFRRDLGEREAVPIPGTDDGEAPFFSPDGRWLGFVAESRLMKVAAEGGRPFELAQSLGAGGATWLGEGTIVFAPLYSDGLFRISAEGGATERLTSPNRADGELGHWWPRPLPGDRKVVFTAFRTPVDRSRIGVLDLDTRRTHWVVDGGFFGQYVATGHLLYARGHRLFALPLDAATALPTGPAAAVVDDLLVDQTGAFARIAVSSRGTLAYVTESLGNPPLELVWLDRDGRASPALAERRRFVSVGLSPDGSRAAVTIQGESRDLWVLALERGTLSRLTSGADTEFDPVWSADGSELFYVVDRPPFTLHRIAVGAPDSGRPIWDEPSELDTTGPAVSPDGRTLAFVRSEEVTGNNLYTRPLDGSRPPVAFRAARTEENFAAFSPDGRWIVYQSDETGRTEVYVAPFPGPGERFQISADGGREPVWAGNGEIFYRRGDELRVVATRRTGRFEFDSPRALFTFPIIPGGGVTARTFSVSADGRRILAITTPAASRPRQIEIVTDWTGELERLAPRGGRP